MTLKAAAIWAWVSALLMLIGATGPWATAFGVLSVSGTDGDGTIVLIAALILAGLVLLRFTRTAGLWALIVALLAGLVGAATWIYDAANIQSEVSNAHGQASTSLAASATSELERRRSEGRGSLLYSNPGRELDDL